MLKPSYTGQFERDLGAMLKRGKKGDKIKAVMRKLIEEDPLEARFRDHKLAGKYKDRRECHVEPDWLLIYKKTKEEIVFERTGSHTDLFE
jgi:mRNA interferase YafQ